MYWVIWNRTKDKYWSEQNNDWTNRYYANKYTLEEISKFKNVWLNSDDLIIAVIAINV